MMAKTTKESHKEPSRSQLCLWKVTTIIVSVVAIILAVCLIALKVNCKDYKKTDRSETHRNVESAGDNERGCIAEPGETVDVNSCARIED